MGGMYALARKLILVVIFAGFCELLLPRSSFRAYLRLVVGLVVIGLLLQPLAQLRGGLDWEQALQAGAEEMALPESNWQHEATDLVEEQLAADAKDVVAEYFPAASVQVELELEYDGRGNLQDYCGMTLFVTPGGKEGIRPVEPVTIGEDVSGFQQLEDAAFTRSLAEKLGLEPETITVMVFRRGGEGGD